MKGDRQEFEFLTPWYFIGIAKSKTVMNTGDGYGRLLGFANLRPGFVFYATLVERGLGAETFHLLRDFAIIIQRPMHEALGGGTHTPFETQLFAHQISLLERPSA